MKSEYGKIFSDRVRSLVGEEYTFLEDYIKAKTKIKVRHNICNYEYYVSPDNFVKGTRCPSCSGNIKKSDEEFSNEIYKLVGKEYSFLESYTNSGTPIKVIHNNCGNIYKVRPSSFIQNNARCPKCANENRRKLKTLTNEQFLAKIINLVDNEYTFLEEYKGAYEKILVKHNICGNVYKVSPHRFSNGNRCKKCADEKQRKRHSEFIIEVFALVGDEYSFLEEYRGARKKLKIIHNTCGKTFSSNPNNFLRGNRCPHCNISKGEIAISRYLDKNGINFKQQITFPELRMRSLLRYDFAILGNNGSIKLLIEYDGHQHFEPIEIWGGEQEFKRILESDRLKDIHAKEKDIPLIRIPYWDYQKIDEILDDALLKYS